MEGRVLRGGREGPVASMVVSRQAGGREEVSREDDAEGVLAASRSRQIYGTTVDSREGDADSRRSLRRLAWGKEGGNVSEKVVNLVVATRMLLAYMEESPVFDKLADAGCGGVDAYRSE